MEYVWYLYQTQITRINNPYFSEILGIFEDIVQPLSLLKDGEILCRAKLNHKYGENEDLPGPYFTKENGKIKYATNLYDEWEEL